MPFEQRPNTGTLFRNDRKTKDNQPDYKGKINVNGEVFELAAWLKEGKKGKFFSLSISAPREGGYSRSAATAKNDEDIPF